LEVSLFKFHAQKDKENMENKTHSVTHPKGPNIDPFKFAAPLKLSLASSQEPPIWTSLYSNPPWYKMVIKGGTSHFIHLIILTQFDILPSFIYPLMAVQILLLFRGQEL